MNLSLDAADLRPIVAAVVAETLQALRERDALVDGHQLAYSEAEAASLIGVKSHVLRDARRRGELRGKKVGRVVVITTEELRRFLAHDDRGRV